MFTNFLNLKIEPNFHFVIIPTLFLSIRKYPALFFRPFLTICYFAPFKRLKKALLFDEPRKVTIYNF